MICRVCGNSKQNTAYIAKEMMFGFRDEFQYFQCADCECLQISEVPKDMSKYYPSNYYSFSTRVPPNRTKGLKHRVRMMRNRACITREGVVGAILNRIWPLTEDDCPNYILRLKLPFTSRILDVGCGNGALTCDLRNLGYRYVTGVDAFISGDIAYENGVVVRKAELSHIDGEYDVVLFHHAYEHLSDPQETLQVTRQLLSEGGICLIVIPTVSSHAWNHYKTDWVKLDAPRHFFLHSRKSMALLAERTGFEVVEVVCDSNADQFWGSEQYRKGIPLTSEQSYARTRPGNLFSEEEMMTWRRRAEVLNREGMADQIQVVLRKSIRSAGRR